MSMFWVGEDGALRIKESAAVGALDCELSGRQPFGSVRVMPACQRGAPEFQDGIGEAADTVARRKIEPRLNRRRSIDRHHPQPLTFSDAMATAPDVLPVKITGLVRSDLFFGPRRTSEEKSK